MGFWDGVKWVWNLRWCRVLWSWELDQSNSLISILNNLNYSPFRSDKLIWSYDSKGVYSVKCASSASIPNPNSSVPLVNKVWRNLVPPKVEIFIWMATLKKLNTKDLLLRKGIIDISTSSCSFCHLSLESVDHLFVLCPLAHSIWFGLLKWWGLS